MKRLYLFLAVLAVLVTIYPLHAQKVLSSATLPPGYTDNMAPAPQTGTEIINTPAGQSVRLASGGSFEHVGQFYVAASGKYEASTNFFDDKTDYFGYAPPGSGTYNGPYLGIGIMGASPNNGGSGAGTPSFYNLILTNTGAFPVVAGIQVYGGLTFGTTSGSGSSIITVPDEFQVTLRNSLFIPVGANNANYIDGRAGYSFSFAGGGQKLLIPVGDSRSPTNPYHPLVVTTLNPGFTARYLHSNPLSVASSTLGAGIGAVSSVGCWIGYASEFTSFTATIPQPVGLGSNPNPDNLRLVGWNGNKWIILSLSNEGAKPPAAGSADLNGYTIAGVVPNHINGQISVIGIGTIENALPVSLISFTGEYLKDKGASLKWQTSLETNNDHFEIQRSTDAKSFETIERMKGQGTTQALTEYTFIDELMPAGLSYYRLKQVDIGGHYEYSSIISIRYGDMNQPISLRLSPNPVKESLTLSLSNGEQIKEVTVYDLKGQKFRQTTSIPEVASLPTGNYVVEVQTGTGQRFRKHFIKQ